jgi:DNA replication protein DnaC
LSADTKAWIASLAERAAAAAPGPTCYHCMDRRRTRSAETGEHEPCEHCNPPQYAPGTPREFLEATLANYGEERGNRTALELARAFVGGERDLFLCGGVGAGKTRLACSIANAAHVQRRNSALFLRVPKLLHELEPSRSDESRLSLERRVCRVPLLVLDDIGSERDRATDYSRRMILMIAEARYDHGRRTIWTSNMDLDRLAQQQGDDRLASRIAGRSDVVLIACGDHRVREQR